MANQPTLADLQAQMQLLLAQNQALQAKVGTMEQAEKARTASVYVSRNGNLTLSWRKAGVPRSWLQPTKSQDGRTWSRGGFVPTQFVVGNGVITMTATLQVDAEEANLFQQKFIMQNVVEAAPSTKGQPATTSTPQATPTLPPTPTSVAPVAPASNDAIVAEAQALVAAGLYGNLLDGVNAVKKSRGIK